MTYDNFSCAQLVEENTRLQQRIGSVAGDVDKKAHGDAVKMGVGLVLFWPTLFFLKGNGPEAQEYAQLKGQDEAFEQAYVRKNCAGQAATTASIGPAAAGRATSIRPTSYEGPGATPPALPNHERRSVYPKYIQVRSLNMAA